MTVRALAHSMLENVNRTPDGDWWGKVTAVNVGPPKTITVQVNGASSTVACRYSASYGALTPAVGDVVFGRCDEAGDRWAVDRLA